LLGAHPLELLAAEGLLVRLQDGSSRPTRAGGARYVPTPEELGEIPMDGNERLLDAALIGVTPGVGLSLTHLHLQNSHQRPACASDISLLTRSLRLKNRRSLAIDKPHDKFHLSLPAC